MIGFSTRKGWQDSTVHLWLLLIVLAITEDAAGQMKQQQQYSVSATNITNNPYKHRPGCHRVGHSRTISIPGCVKFNLQTNACRGYCMSYSIPAIEDVGHPTIGDDELARNAALLDGGLLNQMFAQQQQQSLPGLQTVTYNNKESTRKSKREFRLFGSSFLANGGSRGGEREHQEHTKAVLLVPEQASLGESTGNKIEGRAWQIGGQRNVASSNNQMINAMQQSLDSEMGVRHDIVSVSQCCSMMETEEVTVNLRCGANEIRRLTFKSAKTCECFFCKRH